MVDAWRSVRVFISSTFRDMHAERDHLVRVVFPELRDRLLRHRVYLDDIDLRWGVTREQAENDNALEVCLQQVAACRPFFLGILGDRYGWVPRSIPELIQKDYGLVQFETGRSITELEILFGVLLMDPRIQRRSFFYFRDPKVLEGVPEEVRRSVYTESDPVRMHNLADLKDKIRRSGCPVCDGYSASWDPDAYDPPTRSRGRLIGLGEFGQQVHDQLWEAIREELGILDEQPAFEPEDARVRFGHEADEQKRFMESRLRVYVDREDLQSKLIVYADGDEPISCLMTGPAGSGKSAALAKFVVEFGAARGDLVIIPHFVGASSRSTALQDVLRRLCWELFDRVFRVEKENRLAEIIFADEQADQDRQSIETEYEIPEELDPLSKTWRRFLLKIPIGQRVVIVIDAVDRLEESDRARELYWLPIDLPPHVKLVVSGSIDPESDKVLNDPVARAFRYRSYYPVRVGTLPLAAREEIIRRIPSLSAKVLDTDQIGLLLNNPATANPLFLRVALEELRGFGSFERLNERIAALPRVGSNKAALIRSAGFSIEAMQRAGDPVTALFTQVIERLEAEFGSELTKEVLTFLATSRHGLMERELQELVTRLSKNGELFPLLRQLRPYLLGQAGLLTFQHGKLLVAVQKYFLDTEEKQREVHSRLASYFDRQENWLEPLTAQRERALRLPPMPRPANTRKIQEVAWHWLKAREWDALNRTLTNLDFLEAKVEGGQVFDLARSFVETIGQMPVGAIGYDILQLLSHTLRIDVQFIARHPIALFQCFWNRCWWFDCPEAAVYYEPPDEAASTAYACPPWERTGTKLFSLLESWREEKEHNTPGFVWIRSLRPPDIPLGGPLAAEFRHEDGVRCVAFDPTGRRLASASYDETVRIWDTESGAEIASLRGHQKMAWSVIFDPTGHWIATGALDWTVRIWDAMSGVELTRLEGHEDSVLCVAFDPTGRRLASASCDGTVRIWDVVTSTETACLRGHEGKVTSVAFDPTGRRLASASYDKTVRIWDTESGAEIASLRGHQERVLDVAFDPTGRRLVSHANDTTVRIWDTESGVETSCLQGTSMALDPTGPRLAVASGDTVRILDIESITEIARLRVHEKNIWCMAFDPSGRQLATGWEDNQRSDKRLETPGFVT